MTSRSAMLCLLVAAPAAFAQTEWAPPPLPTPTSKPAAAPAPSAAPGGDDLKFGVQLHGDISGGTGGFGGAASVGFGWNRVALLLTPSLGLAPSGNFSSVFSFTIDVSVRIYLHQRQAGLLVAFLRPSVGVGVSTVSSTFGSSSALFGIGFGGGGEYLLTKNLGFSAELALRFSGVTGAPIAVGTIGSVGIVLHQ